MAKQTNLPLGTDGFSVPIEAITNTLAIFGVRGSGKSNVATVFAEGIVRAGQPICVIDPTGSWWGMTSSKDGRQAGLPIYVFGGEHADIPLEHTAGEIMANFLVKERVPVILDLKLMRKGEQVRFVMQFAEALYHSNREPLMVMIDECPRFAPQTLPASQPEIARCLGAIADIVTLGRTRGLGATTLAQRPALINTTVRTQAENLICLRTIGKHDRKALDEWVEAKGTTEQRNVMMADLASLPNGTGYFWSPAWLGEFRKVPFLQRSTFDSGRTPKIGEKILEPQAFAEIDKAKLTERILATVERARADDPKELRKRIAELERAVRASTFEVKTSPIDPAELERKVKAAVSKQQTIFASSIRSVEKQATAAVSQIEAATKRLMGALSEMVGLALPFSDTAFAAGAAIAPTAPPLARHSFRVAPGITVRPPSTGTRDSSLSKAERSLLGVLAQFPVGRSRLQLSILSGYSSKSSSFANAIGALRSKGFAAGSDPIIITAAGVDAAADIEPVPTDADFLRQHWMSCLGKAERSLFAVLCEKHSLSKQKLSELSGYSMTSSSFANAIGRLRSLQLVSSGVGGTIDLAEELL